MATTFDESALVSQYAPLLVLYPEIPRGSAREEGRNLNYPDEAPLKYDYHPRDIRLVLENTGLSQSFLRSWIGLRRARPTTWQRMLDRMERASFRRDLDLLPGVRSDDRPAFWRTYSGLDWADPNYQRACYANVEYGSGTNSRRVIVQYWYAYFYNDFWNTHEMDWETVMIVFSTTGGAPVPTVCAYSAHFAGHWLRWAEVEKANESLDRIEDGNVPEFTHPVVYVAHGSHANYFYGHHGEHRYAIAPHLVNVALKYLQRKNSEKRGLTDYTSAWGDGEKHLIPAALTPRDRSSWTDEWRWLRQQGRWGSRGEWDLEFGDSGPYGPPQAGDRWDHPFRWIDSTCVRALPREQSFVPSALEPD